MYYFDNAAVDRIDYMVSMGSLGCQYISKDTFTQTQLRAFGQVVVCQSQLVGSVL